MSSVDIIIPSYKYASFLDDCVNSVLTQDGVEIRVLIIDDASPDDTPAVCARLSKQDARVEFRRHDRNQGHISTYNEGLEWAQGDYLMLLSADDWLAPGALARAACVLDANPEVVVTCGNALVAEVGKPLPKLPKQPDNCDYKVVSGERFIEKCCADSTGSPLWTPTAVVRTSVQKKIGGYNDKLPHAGDLEMWLRFACHGSIAYLDAFQAYYRKHGDNMHYIYTKTALQNTFQHLSAFDSVFQKYGDMIPDRKRLSRIYRRFFALDAIALAHVELAQKNYVNSEKYRAFALTVFPEIRMTKQWLKFCLARIIGPELTRGLRTLLASTGSLEKNCSRSSYDS